MTDFKFGTLVFLPSGGLREAADQLRHQFDPASAQSCAAHVTITQPLTAMPTPSDIEKIETVIKGFRSFEAQIGPAICSPNQRLIWLDVNPKNSVLQLRKNLHETGLFRTDLRFTEGFIPHLTLSELPRALYLESGAVFT